MILNSGTLEINLVMNGTTMGGQSFNSRWFRIRQMRGMKGKNVTGNQWNEREWPFRKFVVESEKTALRGWANAMWLCDTYYIPILSF